MKHPSAPPIAALPLFAQAEVSGLEKERLRLVGALKRMRKEHRTGEIQRTQFRLQILTGRILAAQQGKEWVG